MSIQIAKKIVAFNVAKDEEEEKPLSDEDEPEKESTPPKEEVKEQACSHFERR